MYYRRYFAGRLESTTGYKTISDIGGGNVNNYYNQTNVLLSAIKQTLEDVGIQCECREADAILVIDRVTVQFVYTGVNTYRISVNGEKLADVASGGSSFSNADYRFYVTLKGDIDGILQIFIGWYTNPTGEGIGIAIGKGVDLRDGIEIRGVRGGSYANSPEYLSVLKNDRILENYNKEVAFGYPLTNVPDLNNKGTEVTLVECVAQPGRFKLNNCYFGNNALQAGYFYNIGGDIYYVMNNQIMVKCVNT